MLAGGAGIRLWLKSPWAPASRSDSNEVIGTDFQPNRPPARAPRHKRAERVRARRGAALNRLGREEREVLRARDGLRATRDGELAVDVFQVRLHGLRRDPQSASDLLVRLTLGHEL